MTRIKDVPAEDTSAVSNHVVANSLRPAAAGASRLHAATATQTLSVSLRLRRKPEAPALDLARLSAAPHGQREHLSREDYAARFGASAADIDKVGSFALDHGLKAIETSAARRTVVLQGTVEQMNAAFGVDLTLYQTATQVYRGHEGEARVPAGLADIVESVHGLDNRQVVRPHFRALAQSQGITAQAVTALTPPQVAKLYGFPVVSAAGQTIGIIEFGGGYKLSDVQAYFNDTVHLPVPNLTFVGVDGATNSPGGDADVEVILDIDVAGSTAPGANLVVYFAPNTTQGVIDAITTAVHDTVHRPSVLSISWGGPEAGWGNSIAAISAAFQEAAAVGVTVFLSSGDSGSEQPAVVEYPASDPWVTGCGGTTVDNVSGAAFTQEVWGGSGGGVSNHFTRPSWQNWAGIPVSTHPAGHVGRGVPDVAGNADPRSGYQLTYNGVSIGPVGGTSAVAPLYAGLVALLNASLGEPVGFLNYNLYAFSGPAVYRDITTGNNGAYASRPGWDACTGFGSLNGTPMLNALWGVGLPPALAPVGNGLLMTWKGMERDDGIYSSAFNGSTWTPQTRIPGIGTSSGTALAEFNGQTFMAWKGVNDDQGIYWSSYNGSVWTPQKEVAGVGTSTGPRLAVFNGKLYMAWKGIEGDQGIYWSAFNGSAWAPQQIIPQVASSVGPALATFGNQLFAVWKGEYGDQGIYYASFNGATWTTQKLIPGVASSEGPSLAVYNGQLFAAWKGMLSDERLWWSHFNGTSWAPQQTIAGVASSVGPSLAVSGSKLFAAWKGMLGDQRVWYSHFDGTAWAPQQIVANIYTSPDL